MQNRFSFWGKLPSGASPLDPAGVFHPSDSLTDLSPDDYPRYDMIRYIYVRSNADKKASLV